ncbi:MAG: efflux RND transporter permease subunit [Planctomycetota bacterium]
MQQPHAWALARPGLTLAVWVTLIGALSPGLARLTLRTDGLALVPSEAPELRLDRSIREEFGVEDQIAVVVESDDPRGIYAPDTLGLIARLTSELAAIPSVRPEDVVSLATEPGDHVRPGTLEFQAWLDPLPATEKELASLRAGLERAEIYHGTLVSLDSPPSAAAILVGVREEQDRGELHRTIRDLVGSQSIEGHRLLIVGAPVVESQMGTQLLGDLCVIVPVAFLLMGAILFVFLRRFLFVALPLLGVGACIVLTFELMGWFGVPIYLTCLVMPVVLTAIGVAASLHVLDRYQFHGGSLQATLRELARPVVFTSITTAVGFLSFALSPVVAVQAFGVFTAVGTLLLLLWSLTALPACLALADRAQEAPIPTRGSALRDRIAAGLTARVPALRKSRKLVLTGFSALILLAAFAASRVRIEDSWTQGFPRSSEILRATERVDQLFGGTHLLRLRLVGEVVRRQGTSSRAAFDGVSMLIPGIVADPPRQLIHHRVEVRPAPGTAQGALDYAQDLIVTEATVEGGDTRLFLTNLNLPMAAVKDLLPANVPDFSFVLDGKDRLRQLALLGEIRELEAFLGRQTRGGVGAVIGPWSQLVALNRTVGGGHENAPEFLATRDGLAHAFQLYVRARGERRLREIYSPAFDRALVTVLVRDPSYAKVAGLLEEIRAYEREHLAPIGIALEIGGDIAVSQSMIGGIVSTQALSLIASVLTVFVLAALLTRSILGGLVCVVPCGVAVLLVFGFMGAFSIPLGIATSMFAAIAIGVGDDYAIHMWESARTKTPEEAVSAVGPAIVIDALAVGTGFGLLVLSQVPTNARLGALLAIAIAACLVATLVLLPLIFRRTPRVRPEFAGNRSSPER